MTAMVIGMTVSIVLVVVVIFLVFIVGTYNKLVVLRNKVRNSYAQVETQLQRRFDLIPNLVETVQGVASHERELLEVVTASRNAYLSAGSATERLGMNTQLSSNLRTLFAVAENYPELKSNVNFLKLQEELTETEEDVAFARQFYNDAVTIYNNKRQMFPGNLLAGVFGFEEESLFYSDDDARTAPQVRF